MPNTRSVFSRWLRLTGVMPAVVLSVMLLGFSPAALRGAAALSLADSRLLEAVKNGDVATVQELVAAKSGVNFSQPDGSTPLMWAVYNDDHEMAKVLASGGANLDAANEYGVTALSLACSNRNPEMVLLLLDKGASPNLALWSGETALMTCATHGLLPAVEALLAHGAAINAVDKRRGQSALMLAIYEGQKDVARLLIERGADIRLKSHMVPDHSPMIYKTYGGEVQASSKGGHSALMFAAQQGDIDSTRLLLAKGAQVNETSHDDGPPLVIAAANGFPELAMLLLDNGADPNATDSSGVTALHFALRSGLKSLYGMGDDPIPGVVENQMAERRETPTGLAAGGIAVKQTGEANSTNHVNQLLLQSSTKREASPILPGPSMPALVKALLARGADANLQIRNSPYRIRTRTRPQINLPGATPLLLAAAHADVQTMRTLIEYRAKPLLGTRVNEAEMARKEFSDDAEFQGSITPLLAAAGLGRNRERTPADEAMALEAVKILVGMGTDVNAANETGWAPIHAAAWTGATSIVEFLAGKGAKLDVQNGCGQTPLSLAGGTSPLGLRVKLRARVPTVELLKKLGAGKTAPAGPVGHCIPGRVPLLADLFGQ